MIDIVIMTDAVLQMHVIVDGCENIILGNMLGAKLMDTLLCLCLDGVHITAALLQDLAEHDGSHLFVDAAVAQIKAEQVLGLGGVVGEDLDRDAVVEGKRDLIDTVLLNLARHLAGQRDACLADKLAREGVDGGFSQLVPDNASGDIQLLIIFIAADRREVVALGVKEQVVDEQLRALHQRRFARTELLVSASSPSVVLFSAASVAHSSFSKVALISVSSPNIARMSASDSTPSARTSTVIGIFLVLSILT